MRETFFLMTEQVQLSREQEHSAVMLTANKTPALIFALPHHCLLLRTQTHHRIIGTLFYGQ